MIKKFFCKHIKLNICSMFILFFLYNFKMLKLTFENYVNIDILYFNITFILLSIVYTIFSNKYEKVQHNYNTILSKFYNKTNNTALSILLPVFNLSLFYLLLFLLTLSNVVSYIIWIVVILFFLFINFQEIIVFYKLNSNEFSINYEKSLYLFLIFLVCFVNITWYLVLTLLLFGVYF